MFFSEGLAQATVFQLAEKADVNQPWPTVKALEVRACSCKLMLTSLSSSRTTLYMLSHLENDEKWLLIKQFRKKKRSLHEATARKGRKIPNRNQVRNSKNTPCYKGFYLNDKVTVLDKIGYITGFTGNGAYVKDTEGNYVTLSNKTYKQVSINQLRLKYHNNNWQYIMCIAV